MTQSLDQSGTEQLFLFFGCWRHCHCLLSQAFNVQTIIPSPTKHTLNSGLVWRIWCLLVFSVFMRVVMLCVYGPISGQISCRACRTVKLQNSFHTTAETQPYSYVSDCLLRNMKGTQEGKMLFLLQNKPSFSLLWIISHRNAVPAATWFFSINLCKLCKFVRVWVWGITPERSDSRSFSGHNRVFYKWSSSNTCITTDREEIAIFSSTVQHTHTRTHTRLRFR